MKKYIIALDQGTTSSRAIIFDAQGKDVAMVQKPLSSSFPHPGWVEQDPMEILSSQISVLSELMTRNNIHASQIDSIGITNQRETTIVWNRHTGLPVYKAIVWQSRQSADIISELVNDEMAKRIQQKTGLHPDAYFSASKIRFILDAIPNGQEQAEQGDLYFGTVDTWLLYNLSNQSVHVTDYTNASRTMLYNIETLEWDQELLDLFNIPASMLPKVTNSSQYLASYNYGGTQIPITALIGDQQAALFGQTCFDKGSMKNTYGTGCFLLMNTGKDYIQSKHGLVSSIGVGINDEVQYVLEGSVFSAGSILTWLQDKVGLLNHVADSSDIAMSVDDHQDVMLIPGFTGLGAPYWRMDTMASIVNMTLNTQKKHIIKAALDSIALQTVDVVDAILDDSNTELEALYVDGGMSANTYLLQTQADLLNTTVIKNSTKETTALGAAYLAGLATGFYKDLDQLKALNTLNTKFHPTMNDKSREDMLTNWKHAITKHLQ